MNYKEGKNEEYLPPFNNMRFIIPILSRPVYIYVRVDSGTSCVRHRFDKRFLLGSFCQSKSSSVAGLINQPKYRACYNSCLRVTPLQWVPSTETSAVASSPASFQTQMSLWTIFDNNSYHFLGYFLYNNAISHCGEKSWKSLMHETFWWEKVCTTEKGALRAIARIWRLLRHKEIKKKAYGQSEATETWAERRSRHFGWRVESNMTRFSEISRRFYLKNSVTPFEEDSTHEFKGHRNISAEEVPPWCYIPGTDRRSRKAVSR